MHEGPRGIERVAVVKTCSNKMDDAQVARRKLPELVAACRGQRGSRWLRTCSSFVICCKLCLEMFSISFQLTARYVVLERLKAVTQTTRSSFPFGLPKCSTRPLHVMNVCRMDAHQTKCACPACERSKQSEPCKLPRSKRQAPLTSVNSAVVNHMLACNAHKTMVMTEYIARRNVQTVHESPTNQTKRSQKQPCQMILCQQKSCRAFSIVTRISIE